MGAEAIHTESGRTQSAGRLRATLARLLLRRVWVPRALYESVPALYLATGAAALWSALYLPGWTWILPYLVLFGLVCLHAGIGITKLRRRSKDNSSRQ